MHKVFPESNNLLAKKRNWRYRMWLLTDPRFSAPLTTNLLSYGDGSGTPTFTSATSDLLVPNHENILRHTVANEPRMWGARRVATYCNHTLITDHNFSNVGTDGYVEELEGGTKARLVCPGSADRAFYTVDNFLQTAGAVYMVSFDVEDVVNPANNTTLVGSGSSGTSYVPSVRSLPSGASGRYAWKFTAGTTSTTYVRFGLGSLVSTVGPCEMTISNVMVEEISGATNVAPNDFLNPEVDFLGTGSVTGVKYFNTTNGNSWNSSTGEVTETVGAIIPEDTIKGIYHEGSHTNRVAEPFNFTTGSSWVSSGATSAISSTAAPDGRENAYELTAVAGAGSRRLYSSNYAKSAGAETWTASTYFKAGTHDIAYMLFGSINESDVCYISVELSTGDVKLEVESGFTIDAVWTEDVGNGWSRVVMIATTDAVSTGARLHVGLAHPSTYVNSWTADGSETIYTWGAQLEIGNAPNLVVKGTHSPESILNWGTQIWGQEPYDDTGPAEVSFQLDITLPVSNLQEYPLVSGGSNSQVPLAWDSNEPILITSSSTLGLYTSGGSTQATKDLDTLFTSYQKTVCVKARFNLSLSEKNASYDGVDATDGSPTYTDSDLSTTNTAKCGVNYSVETPMCVKNVSIWSIDRGESWLID